MDVDTCKKTLEDATATLQRLQGLCNDVTKAEGVGHKQTAAHAWLSADVRWRRQQESLDPAFDFVKQLANEHANEQHSSVTAGAIEMTMAWRRYENMKAVIKPQTFL